MNNAHMRQLPRPTRQIGHAGRPRAVWAPRGGTALCYEALSVPVLPGRTQPEREKGGTSEAEVYPIQDGSRGLTGRYREAKLLKSLEEK